MTARIITSAWLRAAFGKPTMREQRGLRFSEKEGSYSIGAVALDPNNPAVVWVGTGENNAQRSVGYGDGVLSVG